MHKTQAESHPNSQSTAQSAFRHRSQADPQVNPQAAETPTTQAASLDLAALAQQNAELIGDLQRTRADFENFRKQVDLQKEQAKNLAKHATVSKFLPLIDDMSRAIKAHPDLLSPVQKTLDKTLKSLNLAQIDSTVGTAFNPEFHNAISMDDDEGEKEVIAEELIPGYLYEGQVLRAAMVRVKHQ